MLISIIIPTYNEGKGIYDQLGYMHQKLHPSGDVEIILVDGGSVDQTLLEIERFIHDYADQCTYPIIIERSKKGRARQLNHGASKAKGKVLYFLHADTKVSNHFDEKIRRAVSLGIDAGCFKMKFDQPHALLAVSSWFTRFNWKICRGGDQSLFVKAQIFKELSGFNENYIVYEDCEFINRLYDHSTFKVLPYFVTTSSRKYSNHGMFRLQFHFAMIHTKYWLGASPLQLYQYYDKHIRH